MKTQAVLSLLTVFIFSNNKKPPYFHSIPYFQCLVKEMLKTRKSCFHHFLHKPLETRKPNKEKVIFL